MAKIIFHSLLNIPPFSVSCSGDRMVPEYKDIINDDGIPDVIKCGEHDAQVDIDRFKDDCDIYRILDRLTTAECDPNVVTEAMRQFRPDMFIDGVYGDMTTLPKNIHEVSKFYRDSVAFFNGLPPEVRKEYNYSVDKFFADFDNFLKKYNAGSAASSAAPSAESEVKSDE